MTRVQAEALGVTRRMRRRRVQSGAWVRVLPGVYRLAAAPCSPEQTLLAACLWGGDEMVVSHRSAAALWGLEGFALKPGAPLEVTTTRDLRSTAVQVHVAPRARPWHEKSGLRVGTVVRTLLDLCAVAPRGAEHALNDALRRRLVTLPELQALLHEEGGRGTAGIALMRRLVGRLELLGKPTDSWLETTTAKVLERGGYVPRRQHWTSVEGRRFRLDFAFPEQRVAIETQGYRFHHSAEDWTKDQARHSALTAAGWRVLLVTAYELKKNPSALLTRLAQLLSVAGTSLALRDCFRQPLDSGHRQPGSFRLRPSRGQAPRSG